MTLFFYKKSQYHDNINIEFSNVLEINEDTTYEKHSNIKINGEENYGKFLIKDFKFSRFITGNINIDDNLYDISLSNFCKATNNCYWGTIYKDENHLFTVFLDDKFTNLLIVNEKTSQILCSPANTIEDYKDINSELLIKK